MILPNLSPFPHNLPIAHKAPTRGDSQPDGATGERLSRIVRLLSDNATVVISGTRIAEELGTSRSEVWRAVQHLRELGVRIAGHPATGYQLNAVPDLLLPDILGPLIQGTMFAGRVHHSFRIGSTNAAAMQAAAEGEPEGAVYPGRAANGRPRSRRSYLGIGAIGGHLLLGHPAARDFRRATRCCCR